MKVTLEAGASIDVLSADEAQAQTDQLAREIRKLNECPTVMIVAANFVVDAGGLIGGGLAGPGQTVFDCPPGMVAKLHRLVFASPAYTPAAPLVAGSIAWYRNNPEPGALIEFLPKSPTAATVPLVPALITAGEHNAAQLRAGDSLVFVGAGLPAAANISVNIQVQLLPTTETVH